MSVVIPDRCKPDCAKAYKQLRFRMTELFGGTTTYDAEGTWIDPGGKLVPDHVKVIEAAHSCMTPEQSAKFIRMVREAATEAKQEAMAIKAGQFIIVPTDVLGKVK